MRLAGTMSGVVAGTEAEAAGLPDEPFSVTAIDGQPLDGSMASYCAAVSAYETGDVATFTVVRDPGAEPLDVSVRFG